MIDNKPQFVTPEDFLNYFDKDLNKILKSDNNSNKADMFLKRIEDRLMSWIDANTFRNFDWAYLRDDYVHRFEFEKAPAHEKRQLWKKAILNQAMYVIKNGDIGLDSGYDIESGIVAKDRDLNAIEICRPSMDLMKQAGILNHVVKNRLRYTSW